MRFIEITKENKNDAIIRFRLFEGALDLLENYQDPQNELTLYFDERTREYDELYMELIVREKNTNSTVVLIHYTLGRNHIGSINNIIPVKKDPDKISYTDQYVEKGFAASLGVKALKWIKDEIIKDAKSRGYEIKQIVSLNRHTGARAKAAQDTGKEINQSVSLKLKEYLIYEAGEITIKESLDYF